MNYGMPNPMMGMPPINQPNMMMNNSYTDVENRLAKMERQIKRLDQRITRLETPYKNNNNYIEDDNSMYMM